MLEFWQTAWSCRSHTYRNPQLLWVRKCHLTMSRRCSFPLVLPGSCQTSDNLQTHLPWWSLGLRVKECSIDISFVAEQTKDWQVVSFCINCHLQWGPGALLIPHSMSCVFPSSTLGAVCWLFVVLCPLPMCLPVVWSQLSSCGFLNLCFGGKGY